LDTITKRTRPNSLSLKRYPRVKKGQDNRKRKEGDDSNWGRKDEIVNDREEGETERKPRKERRNGVPAVGFTKERTGCTSIAG